MTRHAPSARRCGAVLGAVALAALLAAPAAEAQHQGVAGTVHNLSVTGPGPVRSTTETEVCVFCHIPHNAVERRPLWGHAMSRTAHYATPDAPGLTGRAPGGQPDGASRLCLSCHDGTVALGDVAGRRGPVPMTGAERLSAGRRGHLGTDLSGSHPISFVVEEMSGSAAPNDMDMGVRPLAAIREAPGIELDEAGKMQCTTCHDPHSDVYYREGVVPHFWVRPTVGEVCLACHELR